MNSIKEKLDRHETKLQELEARQTGVEDRLAQMEDRQAGLSDLVQQVSVCFPETWCGVSLVLPVFDFFLYSVQLYDAFYERTASTSRKLLWSTSYSIGHFNQYF